jgi:hypothetical protein
MKLLLAVMAGASLVTCAMVAFYYFWGLITMQQYKTILFAASILYFVFATLWATRPSRRGL